MADLKKLRQQIDQIDDRILALLHERLNVAEKIGAVKKADSPGASLQFYDPGREREVIHRLEKNSQGTFPQGAVAAVFREIISTCRAVQISIRIAYLGPRGTYSFLAAQNVFGLTVDYVSSSTIESVFDQVERGQAQYGVVPIENSSQGGIGPTLNQLIQSPLKICREIILEINHCLASQESELDSIQRVFSHPQGFAQCKNWLSQCLPTALQVACSSTAEAAQKAAGQPGSAAIASEEAAKIAGLALLQKSIQDDARNATRFVVIHTKDSQQTGSDRTSVLFSTGPSPGSLFEVLSIFRAAAINLTRIESRSHVGQQWAYVFFVDVDGHSKDAKLAQALKKLRAICPMVKILGSYPVGAEN